MAKSRPFRRRAQTKLLSGELPKKLRIFLDGEHSHSKKKVFANEVVRWWESEAGVLFDYAALRPGDKNRNLVFERNDRELALKAKWNERIRSALIRRDASFFRERAEALEFAEAELLSVTRLAAQAFIDLKFRLSSQGRLPTKREIRERTRNLWATGRILRERGSGALRDEIKSQLITAAVLKKFPKQDWTRIFKKLGLEDLPQDLGGQPGHRKRRLLSTTVRGRC